MSSLNIPFRSQCFLYLTLPQMSNLNALAGALGSVIGYLGGEVAEPAVFERLLWPERFYNVISLSNLIEMALFMPMGGPLHKAALETLDVFRQKGLYDGANQGHMLGTAFYQDKKLTYRLHGHDGEDKDCQVRNGLWATVLQQCRKFKKIRTVLIPKRDAEANGGKPQLVRRTTQAVLHLKLWRPVNGSEYENKKVKVFCEDRASSKTVLAIFASELTALICAGVLCAERHDTWFAAYLCIPLLLKLLSLLTSVRREPTAKDGDSNHKPAGLNTSNDTVIFEISDYDHGFPIIEGPEPLVRQFFRHWGHPLRDNYRDRVREIFGITLIFAFVLYFPLGLLSMLWLNESVQVLWLSYQLYAIVVMHIMRIRGSNGRGRIEEGMAAQLASGNVIALKSAGGGIIMAKLTTEAVERIRQGHAKVKEIVDNHAKSVRLRRSDTADSSATLIASSPTEQSYEKLEKLEKAYSKS